MKKFDVKQVPREVLEEICQSILTGFSDPNVVTWSVGRKPVANLLKAAEIKLRTRAQVDADIAEAVREYRRQWLGPLTYNSRFDYKDRKDIYLGDVVNPLIAEKTEG